MTNALKFLTYMLFCSLSANVSSQGFFPRFVHQQMWYSDFVVREDIRNESDDDIWIEGNKEALFKVYLNPYVMDSITSILKDSSFASEISCSLPDMRGAVSTIEMKGSHLLVHIKVRHPHSRMVIEKKETFPIVISVSAKIIDKADNAEQIDDASVKKNTENQ